MHPQGGMRTGFCSDWLLRERIGTGHGRLAEELSFLKNAMRVAEGGESLSLVEQVPKQFHCGWTVAGVMVIRKGQDHDAALVDLF